MEERRGWIVTIMVGIIMVLTWAIVFPSMAGAEAGEQLDMFYFRPAVVVEVDEETVLCQDLDGNSWIFYNEDGTWVVGDIVKLLMFNNSPDYTQHEIVEIFYLGYTEDIDLWFFLMAPWH